MDFFVLFQCRDLFDEENSNSSVNESPDLVMSPSHLIATRERLFALRSRRVKSISERNIPILSSRHRPLVTSTSSTTTLALSTSVPIDLTDESEIDFTIDSSHYSESDNCTITSLPSNNSITLIDDDEEDDNTNRDLDNTINNNNNNNNNNKRNDREGNELSDDVHKQMYIPKYRSGPWAILLAMYIASLRQQITNFQNDDSDCTTMNDTTSLPLLALKKTEIIKHATPLCDSSFETQWDEIQISQSTPRQQNSFK
jgi:hypothetical protein